MPAEAVTFTAAQLREELQELLRLASQYAALESRIESKAMELDEIDLITVLPRQFINATVAEIKGTLANAKGEHGCSDYTALQLCQDVSDAVDLLTVAIERDDRKEGGRDDG